jgi:hypothetical protein
MTPSAVAISYSAYIVFVNYAGAHWLYHFLPFGMLVTFALCERIVEERE